MSSVLEVRPPRFTPEEIGAVASRELGIGGSVQELGSERDQTFVVTSESDSAIVKVSNSGELAPTLDFEAATLLHLATVDPGLPVAAIRRVSEAEGLAAFRTTLTGPDGAHFMRAFDRLPGHAPSDVARQAIADFARTHARLNVALRGFFHPAAGRRLLWDPRNTTDLLGWLSSIEDPVRRRLVEATITRFTERVSPVWNRLRAQVVHGDFTSDNVLVDDAGRVSAIFDFGDSSHSAEIADVAISIASLIADRPTDEAFRTARLALDGYASVSPFEAEELDVLGDLVAARFAALLVIGARRAESFPEKPEYVEEWDAAAWDRLEYIHEIGFERFGRELGGARTHVAGPELTERRERSMGVMLTPLTYAEPVHAVRGEGVWLIEPDGRRLLDAYNNVAVLGHSHPRVTEAVARQVRVLGTHARYLSEPLVELAERLLATMPTESGLDTVMIVNSGSEANDLAWRIAAGATGNAGAIVTDNAYHGVTALSADLSPEEWPPGRTAPGVERIGPDRGGEETERAVGRLEERGVDLAAVFIDPAFTSDGVRHPAPERIQEIAATARRLGGLYVADEVQAGHGRTGEHLWSFAHLGVHPDFVTLGKPMGNGYPVAAVLTRRELVERSGLARRLFSTFGGNQVAAVAALAVLGAIEDEEIVPRVGEVSSLLRDGLDSLRAEGKGIVAVRSYGLLAAVELSDPARAEAVRDALRAAGILIGTTGPGGETLKIRPPLAFAPEHVETLLAALGDALAAH